MTRWERCLANGRLLETAVKINPFNLCWWIAICALFCLSVMPPVVTVSINVASFCDRRYRSVVFLSVTLVCPKYYNKMNRLHTGWAKNGTIYCTPHNFTKY